MTVREPAGVVVSVGEGVRVIRLRVSGPRVGVVTAVGVMDEVGVPDG